MDSEVFDNINSAQWAWYASMLRKDEEEEFERSLDFVEYLASFWNSEAVQNIRSIRETKKDTRFASDEEFERQIRDEEFRKNDELIRSIRDKYKNTNLNDNRVRGARETRLPKDARRLFNLTKD